MVYEALKALLRLLRPIFETLQEAVFEIFGDSVKALCWLERLHFYL